MGRKYFSLFTNISARTIHITLVILVLILIVVIVRYVNKIDLFNIGTLEKSSSSMKTSLERMEHFSNTKWTVAQSIEIIKRFGKEIRTRGPGYGTIHNRCSVKLVGKSKAGDISGAHTVCDYRNIIQRKGSCLFYSFGIADNYDFDIELADEWKCQGLAFDPSIEHNSKLHANVTFHMIAVKTLSDDIDHQWQLVSTVPKLQNCFGHTSIDILKMDCEGCEYSLARDIEEYNVNFFENIDQFVVELHISKRWIRTPQHLINFGKLLYLLDHANLQFVDASIGQCAPHDEAHGCPQELLDIGYPCGSGKMCQNILFAKDLLRQK